MVCPEGDAGRVLGVMWVGFWGCCGPLCAPGKGTWIGLGWGGWGPQCPPGEGVVDMVWGCCRSRCPPGGNVGRFLGCWGV